MYAISRSGLSHWWYAMKWDIALGVASAFHEASAWYTRAWGNSKQGWCRHQAGVETSLRLASTWLAHECLILHGSVPQRGAPLQSPPTSGARRRVLSAPCRCTALLWVFLLACMMPPKLMWWKYSVFRWKGLFIIGATATVSYCKEGRGRKKKTVRCRVSWRDKLFASHAGLHLSVRQWCWHRPGLGKLET